MQTQLKPLNPLPTNAEELARCLADPEWRLFSGCLYKIMIKGDETSSADDDGESAEEEEEQSFTMPFVPNAAQRRFIKRLWHRNLILKARQLGFTTLVAILWLDHALFNADQRCGIIAQDKDASKVIFRDKVRFGYRNLPPEIRERFPLAEDNADELRFAHNNSSIRVATSMRSGTIHRLHVSEFGKICAKYPDKAEEVITGSIPAVPKNGILVIESTAEGREGEFYKMVQAAEQQFASRMKLTPLDYRMHFYAWWMEPKYRLDSRTVGITPEEHEYFEKVEVTVERDLGVKMVLDAEQRAWYVATKRGFVGREERLWQEYPSYPEEAFQISGDGHWYAKDMIALRKRNGVTNVPVLDLPVNTYWDIGARDGCGIWFGQELNGQDRFIRYIEAHNEDLRYYVARLRETGYVFGKHYLPHDANYKKLGDYNKSTLEMLQGLLPGEKFVIVPVITERITGIQMTRKHLKSAFFDAAGCDLGIKRIEGYRKKFNRAENRYTDEPDKSNGCSEGADALRQWAQAKEAKLIGAPQHQYEEPEPADWRL